MSIKKFSKRMLLKLLLFVSIVMLLFFYFKVFFTTGTYFGGTFLNKKTFYSGNYYIGKSEYGEVEIIVSPFQSNDRTVEVTFNLPNNIKQGYIVNLMTSDNMSIGIQNIKDELGEVLFSGGQYMRGVGMLINEQGEPLWEDRFQPQVSEENPYTASYKVHLSTIAGFASFSNDTIRGNYEYLMPAILLLIITLIDFKFPLLFFTLKNSIYVRDPDPSDFYKSLQKLSWYAYPLIAVILMIAAIL